MMNEIISVLKEIRPEFEFVGVDDFFARGMLDSFDLTSLVAALEGRYNITIDGDNIVPENFRNADAIVELLRRYKVSV